MYFLDGVLKYYKIPIPNTKLINRQIEIHK
jgi:hypothetical protein